MKLFYLIFLLFSLTSVTSAQEEWRWQNPIPTNNILINIKYFNDSTVYCLGYAGFLMKSTDSGLNWEYINTGTSANLYNIYFLNDNEFLISGKGTIIKSFDGGLSWQVVYTPPVSYSVLYDIFFVNQETGWASGNGMSGHGLILKTTDGGNTWEEIISGTYDNIPSIYFFNENDGLFVDWDALRKTTDGGTSWYNVNTGFNGFRKMYFLSTSIAFIIGYNGLIIKTTDGGNTWEQQNSFTDKTLRGIEFRNESSGIAVGIDGTILVTTDAGELWSNMSNQYGGSETFYSTTVNNEGIALSAGTNGELIRSTDDGFTWNRIRQGVLNNLNSIFMIDTYKGWVVGDNGIILHTSNSGSNWIKSDSLTGLNLHKVLFTSESNGWILGDSGFVCKTSDEGLSWELVNQFGNNNLNCVYFINQDRGWITGSNGSIFVTTDGGSQWMPQNSNVSGNLTSISFTNEDTGFIIQSAQIPYLLKTTDGGNLWEYTSGFIGVLTSMYFSDPLHGWITGYSYEYPNLYYAKIYKTSDGGANWQTFVYGYGNEWGYYFYDAYFLDPYRGWILGRNNDLGLVAYTTSGGVNLDYQRTSAQNKLRSASIKEGTEVWVVGDKGTILYNGHSIVPVELISFNCSLRDDKVFLGWSTASETNNQRFEIERKIIRNDYKSDWILIGYKKAGGTSTERNEYSFVDNIRKISADTVKYRLKQIDYNGAYTYSQIVQIQPLPLSFSLSQNYPNPFNPSTKIGYQIPEQSKVKLIVYDVLGREIKTLVNEEKSAGFYEVEFNGSDFPSGVYFYRIEAIPNGREAGKYSDTKKFILLK